MFTFTMSEAQARNVHAVVHSQCQALKNWIVTAVENDQPERAKEYARELRQYQALYAAFNMTAKHEIAKGRNLPVEQNIAVRDN